MVLEARWGCVRSGIRAAFERGRAAEPFVPVYWERYFDLPLEEVRARLGIRPWTPQDRAATRPWALQGPRVLAA